MATKRRGLGRGLDALLAGNNDEAGAAEETETAQTGGDKGLRELGVHQLKRGKYQPRSQIREEGLRELAESIAAQGVVQPIIVRPVGESGGELQYEIIAGERRWRASQLAGLQNVPVVIRDVGDEAAVAMALIENIQREDLNALEEALALQRLVDEFELTHEEAAKAVGRSRAAVSNLLRLLELNFDLKQFVEQGKLDMGHARALLALKGKQQSEAGRQVVNKGMTVRQTEALVREMLEGKPQTESKAKVDPDLQRLQIELGEKLGAKVAISHSNTGKGKLTISYHSLDELDGLLARIK